MTTTEDWTPVDNLADDPETLAALDREVIVDAIKRASDDLGRFSAFDVRCRHARDLNNPKRSGAVLNGLIRAGVVRVARGTKPSLNAKSRNRNRPMPTYRVVGEVR